MLRLLMPDGTYFDPDQEQADHPTKRRARGPACPDVGEQGMVLDRPKRSGKAKRPVKSKVVKAEKLTGSQLRPRSKSKQSVVEQAEKKCPRCGEGNRVDRRTCWSCGSRLWPRR